MRLYKVLHIPSELYWKPSTHANKRNLSPKGKVYQSKPSIESWLNSCGRLSYTEYEQYLDGMVWRERVIQVPTQLKDWKIIELNISEE